MLFLAACVCVQSVLMSIGVCGRYLVHVRPATVAETAGGYESHIACQRALHDAFCGLSFLPTDSSASVMESS